MMHGQKNIKLVVDESYTLARWIPTLSRPYSLNTFQVFSYQNWTGIKVSLDWFYIYVKYSMTANS